MDQSPDFEHSSAEHLAPPRITIPFEKRHWLPIASFRVLKTVSFQVDRKLEVHWG